MTFQTYQKPEDMTREELVQEVHDLRKTVGASQIALRYHRQQAADAKMRRRWANWEA